MKSQEPNPSNSQQKYLAKVQQYLANGKITPIGKSKLVEFAEELGIPKSEANLILEKEIAEIELAKQKYRELLEATIAEGLNPFNPQIQAELQELQKSLRLTDTHIELIWKTILTSTNMQFQNLEGSATPPANLQRVINIYQGNYNEKIKGDYVQGDLGKSPEVKKPESDTKIKKFSFEVITVDNKGQENSRTTKEAEYFREDLMDSVTLDMVKIPGGEFQMGSSAREGSKEEKPQHQVSVCSFWIGKYLVTQEQWRTVAKLPQITCNLDLNPSYFKGDKRPVESFSWDHAKEFCLRLTECTGNQYRLPSEAEWEYACRAGTKSTFHFGSQLTPTLAKCKTNSLIAWATIFHGETIDVGQFEPNAFGLYDMHGNVWEWCEDDWHDNYNGAPSDGFAWISGHTTKKVIRSGSWITYPDECRSAYRGKQDRGYRDSDLGFRVVCFE